jgi:hypothetical protein
MYPKKNIERSREKKAKEKEIKIERDDSQVSCEIMPKKLAI